MDFTHFSGASIVDFKQVNADWEVLSVIAKSNLSKLLNFAAIFR